MQRQQFNTVASACMKILNALDEVPREGGLAAAVIQEGLSVLLRVQAPITPHICHHLWRSLGFGTDVFAAPWPEPDESALDQDEIELVLQVGGKTRGKITVPADATKVAIEALTIGSALAQKYIAGQTIKKVVVVPGRLVNVVL